MRGPPVVFNIQRQAPGPAGLGGGPSERYDRRYLRNGSGTMRNALALIAVPLLAAAVAAAADTLAVTPIALPGATGVLHLDYIACDRATGRVWVPAAGTGSVDVIEPGTLAVTRVDGFPTRERAIQGRTFTLGPTSIALAGGVAYAGNRTDGTICAVDAKALRLGRCFPFAASPDDLATSPDGLVYVAPTKELWVTQGAPPLGILPPDRAIVVLDASVPGSLSRKAKIVLEGAAEGYAVDERHGLFYTNVEDKDQTVAIDVRTHRVVATWPAGCGAEGPRGVAVDASRRLVFVACTDKVVVHDAARNGAQIASLATGGGVDNIDYVEPRRELFVAAGKAATLTVARVDDRGEPRVVATAPTAPGARVVVADREGNAFVIDPGGGRILAVRRR
jgi:DNA-binding beta-propeller fold protein YncE